MRLAEWRIEQGLTQSELAARLGCDQSYISLIERSTDPQTPRRHWMLKIYRLTRGAVTPNDFYDLPDLNQPALQLEFPAPLLDMVA